MKHFINKVSYTFIFLLMLFACTKDVSLVTEVEFEVSEEHQEAGFIKGLL